MGLDQYAYAVTPEVAHLALITERELDDAEQAQLAEGSVHITEWRKHADLNHYMTELYHSKGGEGVFNCIPMPITKDDLLSLRMHLQMHGNAYEHRGQGFFWGETRHEDILTDHYFIDRALALIDEGYEIIYTCWW